MPSPRKLVVVNLRAQPVEIQHGGEVVVLPEFAHAELPELAGAEGQLAELARQGAVAVLPPPPAPKAPAQAPRDQHEEEAAGPEETTAEIALGRKLIVATNIGLNVIEVDGTAAAPIQGAAVSVGAFNVLTRRGVPNQPTRVTSFTEFNDRFGGFDSGGFGAYLVKGFFDNGGQRAYVNRVAGSGANAPTTASATIAQSAAANAPGAAAARGRLPRQGRPGHVGERPPGDAHPVVRRPA